jgi:hypothetical protein
MPVVKIMVGCDVLCSFVDAYQCIGGTIAIHFRYNHVRGNAV